MSGAGEDRGAGAGATTKHVILLATDQLLAELPPRAGDPEAVVGRLVRTGVLPSCYRPRYDARFLGIFREVLEQTRNSLVGDLPFIATTAGGLAARAILRRARAILADSQGQLGQAALDAALTEQIAADAARVERDLTALERTLADLSPLFQACAEPELDDRAVPDSLPFENWLVPLASAPRPRIAPDGRAWPAEA